MTKSPASLCLCEDGRVYVDCGNILSSKPAAMWASSPRICCLKPRIVSLPFNRKKKKRYSHKLYFDAHILVAVTAPFLLISCILFQYTNEGIGTDNWQQGFCLYAGNLQCDECWSEYSMNLVWSMSVFLSGVRTSTCFGTLVTWVPGTTYLTVKAPLPWFRK